MEEGKGKGKGSEGGEQAEKGKGKGMRASKQRKREHQKRKEEDLRNVIGQNYSDSCEFENRVPFSKNLFCVCWYPGTGVPGYWKILESMI